MYGPAAIRRVPPDDDRRTDAASARPVRRATTTTATTGGVLVAVTLRNDTAVDVRVRVDNDLDGPVLPPRRNGVPAAGWDAGGFTGTVPAASRLGIGYACPTGDDGAADAPSDPVSLDVLGPADDPDPSDSDRVADAVRSLGRAAPPADAVPASGAADAHARVDAPAADCRPRPRDAPTDSADDPPTPVAAWLDAVETRVRRAERLADATADEAASVLAVAGGADGVATLPADLDGDAASLRAARDRIDDLASRAAAADPEPAVSSLVAAADDPGAVADGRHDGSPDGSTVGADRPREADR